MSLYIILWRTYCACHQPCIHSSLLFCMQLLPSYSCSCLLLWLWSGAENMKLFNISGWNWRIIARHFDIRQTMSQQQQQQQFLLHTVHSAPALRLGSKSPFSPSCSFQTPSFKNSWVVSAHSKHLKIFFHCSSFLQTPISLIGLQTSLLSTSNAPSQCFFGFSWDIRRCFLLPLQIFEKNCPSHSSFLKPSSCC